MPGGQEGTPVHLPHNLKGLGHEMNGIGARRTERANCQADHKGILMLLPLSLKGLCKEMISRCQAGRKGSRCTCHTIEEIGS